MRTLVHHSLCPFSRKVRVVLREKDLVFELQEERPWERRQEFLEMNPAGTTPVLVEDDGAVISDQQAICEYLEEKYQATRSLIGKEAADRAEVRRVASWFDGKFGREVTENLLGEKFFKRLYGNGNPSSDALRAGRANMEYHLEYIAFLTRSRSWLAGDEMTLADIAAASQLSALDYFDDVPWDAHKEARHWYALMKSRPSFRAVLLDRVPGFAPPKHYADPDF